MCWLNQEAAGDIIFLQEVGVAPGQREEVGQLCLKEGWKLAIGESVRTELGGLSSGVGVG
eukprot:3592595-Pyramimonas_sp.AAC.2